jgi:hypothetical protein
MDSLVGGEDGGLASVISTKFLNDFNDSGDFSSFERFGEFEKLVCIDSDIWKDYLLVDARVAASVKPIFYDLSFKSGVVNPVFRDSGGLVSPLGNPRTYNKFVDIFVQLGLVARTYDGAIFIDKGWHGSAAIALEISAAPYGCLRACLDTGLIDHYFFTQYSGEKHGSVPSQYDDKVTDLGYVCDEFISTDLRTLVKDSMVEVGKSKINWPYVSFLIIDIPLKRNSVAMYSMANFKRTRQKNKVSEFVDDVPLGKSNAQVELITLVSFFLKRVLVLGGCFLLKIIESWSLSVLKEIYYAIAIRFKKVTIVSSRESKPLSKELYFYFSDYVESNCAYFTFNEFISPIIPFMSVEVARLTRILIQMSYLYGREYFYFEKIAGCRKFLYDVQCPFKKLSIKKDFQRLLTGHGARKVIRYDRFGMGDVPPENDDVLFLVESYSISWQIAVALLSYHHNDISLTKGYIDSLIERSSGQGLNLFPK